MIQLNHEPIDSNQVLASVQSPHAGAVVLFLGTTREFTAGRQTESLDYESYGEMAASKLQELEEQARQQWALTEVTIVHRLGHLEIGEASVAIAVSAPHRKDAFNSFAIKDLQIFFLRSAISDFSSFFFPISIKLQLLIVSAASSVTCFASPKPSPIRYKLILKVTVQKL